MCHYNTDLKVVKYYCGGGIMSENVTVSLGDIIKEARQKANLKNEELAERLGISVRYLYRIENEDKKPSFDILYNLIRELSISPDTIFYPENASIDAEVEDLIRRLYKCDDRSIEVIKATANALINTTPKQN